MIVSALLEHARILSVSGNVVTLGVENDVFVERLSVAEHRSLINFVLSKLHNANLQCRIIVGTEDSNVAEGVNVDNPVIAEGRKLGADIHKHHDKRRQ